MTTKKYLERPSLQPIDILFIDADHSYQGFKYDFENFIKLLNTNGVVIFHDVLVEDGTYGFKFGIKKYFTKKLLHNHKYSVFRLPLWPGLSFVQKNISIKKNNINFLSKLKNFLNNAKT
jgi:predicted O-methyltransferase YrrM